MIVTAAMCYFDDDLGLLEQTLRSLPLVADRLVVADGRYERYEQGGPAASPARHHAFIRRVCKDIGLPVAIDTPDRPYAGQVEKRSRLMGLAQPGSDWIAVVDADHVLRGDGAAVRAELATTDRHALNTRFFTPNNPGRPLEQTAATAWHRDQADKWTFFATFMRALPGIRVEDYHWCYSALVGGRRTWVYSGWGKGYAYTLPGELAADFHVEHRCLFREDRHILSNRAFCDDRTVIVSKTGQEDAVAA